MRYLLAVLLYGCGGSYAVTNVYSGETTYWICSFREATLCTEDGYMIPDCVMSVCDQQ